MLLVVGKHSNQTAIDEIVVKYQSRPRILLPERVQKIKNRIIEAKKSGMLSALNSELKFALKYMRDVEAFTDNGYASELERTPNYRFKPLRTLIDVWRQEEHTHADLLGSFVSEGEELDCNDRVCDKLWREMALSYRLTQKLTRAFSWICGSCFLAPHLTIGMINEHTANTSYSKLSLDSQKSHPILAEMLRSIASEEAKHRWAYGTILELGKQDCKFCEMLSRITVSYFWSPVGVGVKSAEDSDRLARFVYAGSEGLKFLKENFDRKLTDLLPADLADKVSRRIHRAASA